MNLRGLLILTLSTSIWLSCSDDYFNDRTSRHEEEEEEEASAEVSRNNAEMSLSASSRYTDLDLDGDGVILPETDGIILVRAMLGFTGAALVADLPKFQYFKNIYYYGMGQAFMWRMISWSHAPAAISIRYKALKGKLDFDGDGKEDALTDGLMAMRYAAGLRGKLLVKNATRYPERYLAIRQRLEAVQFRAGINFSPPPPFKGVLEGKRDASGPTFDIFATKSVSPLIEGVVIQRYLRGFKGDTLFARVKDGLDQAKKAEAVKRLDALKAAGAFDVDGDGRTIANTDSSAIIAYFGGVRGDALLHNSLKRISSSTMEWNIERFMPYE